MFVIARRDENVRLELTLLPHIALERRHRVAGIRWQPGEDGRVEASLLGAETDMQTSRCDDCDEKGAFHGPFLRLKREASSRTLSPPDDQRGSESKSRGEKDARFAALASARRDMSATSF